MTATDTVKATETRHQGAPAAGSDGEVTGTGQPDSSTSSTPAGRHTIAPSSLARARGEQVVLVTTILIPFLALVAAVPLLWGRWISWRDVILAAVMYAITGHGITIGFHRYFTHRGFKTSRPVRAALAIAGNMAIEGPVIRWVADHRRHHAFSDADGDPHSPWRYGTGSVALARGLWHAHIGWLFDVEQTDQRRYAPDLLDDPMIVRISRSFALCAFVSLALPAVVGGLWGGSFEAAVQAFFWASLVRVALLHHVTWSVNSICHVMGSRPYRSRDHSGNVWPLALLSMGESWHNLHHAEPTSARHGVRPWQVDTSFYGIKLMESLRLVRDVRWPDPARLESKRA
ncbi:acyl-CoA desaturase [Parafrankia sp. FMc2]|uniref:acyl-CoA desaturase n=1 Tax=Parafrankia sp. FMc2 TaxID=3233196 RepID=UPI0034D5E02C